MSETINTIIERAVEDLWPGKYAQCELKPSVGKAASDFSTDICIRLSSQLNRAPNEIAEALLSRISRAPGLSLDVEADFIHVSVSDECLADGGAKRLISVPSAPPSVVIVPLFSAAHCKVAWLRLFSCAFMQAIALKRSGALSTFYAAGKRYSSAELEGAFAEQLYRLIDNKEKNSPAEISEGLASALKESGDCRSTIWLAPDSLPRGGFQTFYRANIHRQNNRLLCCPDADWLYGSDQEAMLARYRAADWAILRSLLFHLISALPSADLDLFVPFFQEKSNIPFFLGALGERLSGIPKNLSKGAAASEYRPLGREERAIILFLQSLEVFESRMALHAEVVDFGVALQHTANCVSLFLNRFFFVSPGSLSRVEAEIISGTAVLFSDIIRPY